MARLLLVDDEESFREVVSFHLREAGYQVDTAAGGREGLELFGRHLHPLVLCDLKMPGMDGLELMTEVHRRSPDTLVVVITAFGSIEAAVEAMKHGAFDFVPKPVSREHLKLVVGRALDHAALKSKVRALESEQEGRLIFAAAAMDRVVRLAERTAPSSVTVLIQGESGTGKELLARRIHRLSGRAAGPFVAVDCAAIPHDLLESELFGHTRGAFTGAVAERKGRFQEAEGGTLFLDEIGELPLELQPKLLRAIEQRAVDVVGGPAAQPVDVRVLAATNRNLRQAVEQGAFRQDLYFRLNVMSLTVPPLRERREDIPLLVEHFLKRHAPGRNLHPTPELLAALEGHSWPGNVRELGNLCQRMALLAEGERLGLDLLPDDFGGLSTGATLDISGAQVKLPPGGVSLQEIERRVIAQALQLCGYNQSAAARYLRIPRHILLYRMEKLGIPTGRLA